MIARTALQQQIVALSATLAPLDLSQKGYFEKRLFLDWGVVSRNKFHCLECAHVWKDIKNLGAKSVKCPACQKRVRIYGQNQVHFKEIEYGAVVTRKGGFQIVRIICSHKQMRKNGLPSYFHSEVMQHWISSKGEVWSMAKKTNPFSGAYDSWVYCSDLEIRSKDFCQSAKFRIRPYGVYPKRQILPLLRRNGFKDGFHEIAPQILLPALLVDSYAETLLKANQRKLLAYYLQKPEQHIVQNWQAVKSCMKNNYKMTDCGTWEDYIALLRYFKKDLCNPAYTCPENLEKEHDRLVERKRTLQRKARLIEMRLEIEQAQVRYAEQKKKFFALEFKDDKLTIQVLQHVRDFMQEGDTLEHCIFTNEYYKRKNSLMLSARIGNKPIETIEVSIAGLEILQSGGRKNKESKYHKGILSLVNKNLYQIAALAK